MALSSVPSKPEHWTGEFIARGVSLWINHEASMWGFAEFLVEAVPANTPKGEVRRRLAELKDLMGCPYTPDKLVADRETVLAGLPRIKNVPFSLYRKIRNRPDAADILSRCETKEEINLILAQDRVTVNEFSVDEVRARTEKVKKLLLDYPEILIGVFADVRIQAVLKAQHVIAA